MSSEDCWGSEDCNGNPSAPETESALVAILGEAKPQLICRAFKTEHRYLRGDGRRRR
jgi:hypothetical protein